MGAGRGAQRRTQTVGWSGPEFQHNIKAQHPSIPEQMLQASEAAILKNESGDEVWMGIFADLAGNKGDPPLHVISAAKGAPEIGDVCPDFTSAAYRLGIKTAALHKQGFVLQNGNFRLPDDADGNLRRLLAKAESGFPVFPSDIQRTTF